VGGERAREKDLVNHKHALRLLTTHLARRYAFCFKQTLHHKRPSPNAKLSLRSLFVCPFRRLVSVALSLLGVGEVVTAGSAEEAQVQTAVI